MTDRALNCVDMSHWGGPLTQQEALDLWDAGVRNIKVGTGWKGPGGAGSISKQQASQWMDVNQGRGGTVDAYVYLYFAGDAVQQCRQGIDALDGIPVRMWWLDAEDVDSPELTPDQRAKFLVQCTAYMRGRGLGIYTARWWWPDKMANTTLFSDLPLWNSWYDDNPDESGLPYGGWQHSAVEQYAGTTEVGGQSVDLNYDSTLGEGEEGFSVEDKARLDRLERIVAGYGMDDDDGNRLTGEAALAFLDEKQRSMYLGLLNTENELAAHENAAAETAHGQLR